MAFRTCHLLVHASQRIACLIVIELGVGTNGLPTRVSVTLLACDGDRPVRICDLGPRSASHLRTRAHCRLLQAHGCKQRRRNQQQKELALTIHPLLRVLLPGSPSCDRLRLREKKRASAQSNATATAHANGCKHSFTRNSFNEYRQFLWSSKNLYLYLSCYREMYARPLSVQLASARWRDVPLTGRVRSLFV